MEWGRRSANSVLSGENVISRARVQGEWIYTLWRGKERIGGYSAAQQAKQAAKEMANG